MPPNEADPAPPVRAGHLEKDGPGTSPKPLSLGFRWIVEALWTAIVSPDGSPLRFAKYHQSLAKSQREMEVFVSHLTAEYIVLSVPNTAPTAIIATLRAIGFGAAPSCHLGETCFLRSSALQSVPPPLALNSVAIFKRWVRTSFISRGCPAFFCSPLFGRAPSPSWVVYFRRFGLPDCPSH
jgi:hypothetical protein